jgi:hypothetical protein
MFLRIRKVDSVKDLESVGGVQFFNLDKFKSTLEDALTYSLARLNGRILKVVSVGDVNGRAQTLEFERIRSPLFGINHLNSV